MFNTIGEKNHKILSRLLVVESRISCILKVIFLEPYSKLIQVGANIILKLTNLFAPLTPLTRFSGFETECAYIHG